MTTEPAPEPELVATCTPNSLPHDDGRVEHGYQINVLAEDLSIVATVDLPDWEAFDPASAVRQLNGAGFTLGPDVSRTELDGWSPSGLGYTAPVVRRP